MHSRRIRNWYRRIKAGSISRLILIPAVPTRDINMCPAMRLAASRKESVSGRTILLRVSISTINMVRAIGVPLGTI